MKQIFTFLLALLLTGAISKTQAQKLAPDFTLEKLSGGNFTLSDYKGKVVLIYTFGYSCPPCITAGRNIVKPSLVNEFSSNNNFVAVAIDDWDGSNSQVQNFKNATELNIPHLLNGSSVIKNYDSTRERLIVIDAQGYIVFQESRGVSSSQASSVKSVILSSLNALSTPIEEIDSNLSTLEQNYPNPFSSTTNFRFNLKAASHVSLDVYSLSGKHVARVANGVYPIGKNEIEFTSELTSGMYFYKINIAGDQHIRKMLVK